MTQSLAALMQPWRNEAKAKLNSEEIFLLDHPTVQDQGFRAVLMPYSVKQRATLQALAQDECAQKVMAAVTKIEQKLQLLKAHGSDFEAHKERYQVKILSALAAQGEHFDLEQDADLYQTLRILEINSMVATQGSLGVTATFLQSIAAYLELYPLCYFLHQMGVKGSDFSPEQMSDPVFDGLDEAHKERIALFATVICDFDGFTQSSLELVELVDALLPSSADMKELATPLIGCALLGLDKSLQALHSLKTLQPEASLPELISTLSEFCANDNQDGPALVRFNALVQSSAFARLKAKAQQLKPQLDDFELIDVGPKNKGPLYQAKKELTLTVAADELTALDQGATTPNQAPAHNSAAASSELSFAASGTLSTSWGNPFAAPAPSAGANSGLGLSISSSLDAGTMGLSTNAGASAPRGLNLLNAASTDSAVGLGISNAAGAQVRTAPAASSAPSGLKPEAAAQLSAGSGAASTLVVSSAAQANSAAKKSNARMDSLELTSAVITSEVSGLMSSAAADGLSLSGANKDQLWSAPSRSSVGATAPAPEAPKPGLAAGLALTPANAPALAQTTAAVQAHGDAVAATETEQAAPDAAAPLDAAVHDQAAAPTKPNAAPADTSAESAESAPVDATQASAAQEPATTSVRSASVAAAASGANTGLELTAASQAATISMLSSSFGSGLALTPASTAPEAAASTKAASEPEGAPAAGAQGVKSAEQSAGSLLEPSSTQGAHGLNLQSATGAPGSLSTSTDANLISADASLGLSLAHADRFGLQLTSAAAAQKAARSLEPTDQASLSAGLTLTPADAISAIAPHGLASASAAKATTPAAPAQTATASERSFAVTSARAQSGAADLDAHSAKKSVASLTERANDASAVSVAPHEAEVSLEHAAGTQADPAQDQASHASAEQSAVSGGASATASSDAGSNALVGALAAASSGDKHSAARDKGGLSLTNAAGDLSVRNSADATQATSSAASLGLSLSPADASTGLKLAAAADNKAPADFAPAAGWSSGLELAPASTTASAESKSHSEAHARAISAPAPSPAHADSNTDQTTSTAPGSNISPASAASSAAAMGLEPRGARAQSASSITAPKSGTATTSGAGLALTSTDSAQNYATETALTVQHGGLELTSATSAASSTAEPNTAAPSAPIAASHQAPAAPQASAQATPVQTGELSLGATSSLARSPAFNALAASTLSQQASAWDLLKSSTSDASSAELLGIVTAAPTVTTPDSGAGAAHGTGTDATSQVRAESAESQTSTDSAASDSKTAVASDASATAASRAETAASDAAVAANAPENSALETSDNKPESSDFALASAEHTRGIRATSAHSDRSSNETVERANSAKFSAGRKHHATESQERVWRQSDIGERRAQEAAPERWVSSTVRARYGASSAHARFDERVKIFSRKSDNTTTERTIGDIEQDQKQRLEAEMNSPEFQALRASRAAQYAAAQAAAEAAAAAENSTEPNPPGAAATSTTSGGSTQAASTSVKAPAKKAVCPVKYVAPTLEVTSATTAAAEQAPDLTGAGAAAASSDLAPSNKSTASSELSLGAASSFDLAFSAAASSTNSWSNFIAPSTDGLTIIGSDNKTAPSPAPATGASSAPISAADLWHSTVNAVKSAQQAAQARKNAQTAQTPKPDPASSQQRTKDEDTSSTQVTPADKPARSAQRSKAKRARGSAQTKSSTAPAHTSVLTPTDEAPLALSGASADSVAVAQTKVDSATSADAGVQHAALTEAPTHTPAATTQANASEEKAAAVASQDSTAANVATVSTTASTSERTDSETGHACSTPDTSANAVDASSKRANAAVEGAPSTDDALSGGTVITTGSAESIAQLSPELQEAFAAASAAWDLSGESTESTKRRNKSKSAQTDDSSRSDELDTSDTPDTTCDSSTAERESDAEEDQVPWLTSDTDSKVSTQSNGTSIPEVQSSAAESKAKPKRGRKSKAKAASSTEAASENTEANSARTTESADAEGKDKRRRSPTKAKKQVAVAEDLSDIEQKLTSGASSNLNSQERAQINAAAAAALFGGSDAASAESVAPSDAASSADSEREMAERVKLGRERRRKAAQGRMVLQELRTVLRTHKRSDQEIPTDEQFDQLSEAEQAKVMVQAKVLLNSLLKELGYRAPPQAKLLAELAQLDPESNASEELSGTPHDEPSSDDARGTEVALQRENQGFTQVAAAYDALAQTDYQPLKLDHAKLEQIAPDFYDHMGDEGVATEELSPEMRAILNKQQDQHALSKLRRFAREVNSELSKQNARANKKQAGLTESEVAAQGVSSKRELTPEEIVRARAQEVRRYIKTGYTEHDHLSAHELKATEVKASALTPDDQRQALQGASAPPKTTRHESQQDSADLLNSAQTALTPDEVELPWDEGAKAAESAQAADGTAPRSMRQATPTPELSLEQVLLSRPELIELEYHLLYGNYFRLSQEQYLELLDEPSAQLKAQSQLSPAAACDLVHSDRHQSRLIAELRPFRELNVMRRVLLELSDQQGDEQRLLRLQRGKFNYYLRLLGRNFFLTANARRVKGDLDPDLERLTNLSAQRNDDEVKFVLATILLTGAGLYLKSEASPLADTYRSLNFAPPC